MRPQSDSDLENYPATQVAETLDTVDTHCVDLQAQLEAGSRAAGRIEREAVRGDSMTAEELRSVALMGSMAKRVRVLRACIREQLATLVDLRVEMSKLRHQLRARDSVIHEGLPDRDRSR